MNDRLARTEAANERLAEQMVALTGTVQKIAGSLEILTEQVPVLADVEKHSDARINSLADMVRHLIERQRQAPPVT